MPLCVLHCIYYICILLFVYKFGTKIKTKSNLTSFFTTKKRYIYLEHLYIHNNRVDRCLQAPLCFDCETVFLWYVLFSRSLQQWSWNLKYSAVHCFAPRTRLYFAGLPRRLQSASGATHWPFSMHGSKIKDQSMSVA